MSPKPTVLSINSHHLPQTIPCMQLMLCLQRTRVVRLAAVYQCEEELQPHGDCNYPLPVAPQSLEICQSHPTPEARGISGLFAIKHIILLPKGILKTFFFFSIEDPPFHPLPLKERAQRSQRYLKPGSKTTVCKNILFHYRRGESLGMLSTVQVIVSKMCLLSAQHQQWIVCILKGKLHVLTLQMVEKVFQIISHLLTVLNKRAHKRQ